MIPQSPVLDSINNIVNSSTIRRDRRVPTVHVSEHIMYGNRAHLKSPSHLLPPHNKQRGELYSLTRNSTQRSSRQLCLLCSHSAVYLTCCRVLYWYLVFRCARNSMLDHSPAEEVNRIQRRYVSPTTPRISFHTCTRRITTSHTQGIKKALVCNTAILLLVCLYQGAERLIA